MGIGLGSPGQPHILVRYMSIDHPDNLRGAALIGTLWNVLLGLGAVSIGVLGRATVRVEALPNGDPELIYLVLSSQHFGPLLYGLLVGGIFAAILSTADSQLLVVASTMVRDLWEKTFARVDPDDEAARLALSRIVVVLAGFAALLLAYFAQDLVFWLVLFAWGGSGRRARPGADPHSLLAADDAERSSCRNGRRDGGDHRLASLAERAHRDLRAHPGLLRRPGGGRAGQPRRWKLGNRETRAGATRRRTRR